MIRWLFQALIMGAALGTAMPVLAVTCYEVIDRTNAVVFRDLQTPVDLSAAGAPLRDAMYRRGEQLVIYDTSSCIVIRPSTTGSRALTSDEIVAGWRPMPLEGKSGWGSYSSRYGGLLTVVRIERAARIAADAPDLGRVGDLPLRVPPF
jgi:hypothetical protein